MMIIEYGSDFSQLDEIEANERGVLSGIIVTVDEQKYSITAFSAERIKLEIDLKLEYMNSFLITPGVIVVGGDLSVASINIELRKIAEGGYFSLLLPMAEGNNS